MTGGGESSCDICVHTRMYLRAWGTDTDGELILCRPLCNTSQCFIYWIWKKRGDSRTVRNRGKKNKLDVPDLESRKEGYELGKWEREEIRFNL